MKNFARIDTFKLIRRAKDWKSIGDNFTRIDTSKLIKRATVGMGVLAATALLVYSLPLIHQRNGEYTWAEWTGFGKDTTKTIETTKHQGNGDLIKNIEKYESGKTLWDWLSVAVIPASLTTAGFLFQMQQKAQSDTNMREQALTSYLDSFSNIDILVDKNLAPSDRANSGQQLGLVRARTLSLMRMLEKDEVRLGSVLSFLSDAGLVNLLKIEDLSKLDLNHVRLSGSNLSGVNLSGLTLTGACFSRSCLQGANFQNSKLDEADLTGSVLENADLTGADLTDADLTDADLTDADLTRAVLINAVLINANLRGANLRGAILRKSCLRAAKLIDAKLNSVDLTQADLRDAIFTRTVLNGNLSKANLSFADLRDTDLRYAALQGADLQGADLQGANLQNSNLQGAKFQGAKNLTLQQVQSAKNWESAHYDQEFRRQLNLSPEPTSISTNSKVSDSPSGTSISEIPTVG